jgi:hypothetical protein
MKVLGFEGILIRFVFALVLVFATYNPSTYSYFHWAEGSLPQFTPALAICGLLLVITWGIYIRATFRSLGVVGLTLAVAFFASFVWLFYDLGWLQVNNVGAMTWVVLVIISLLLAIGMSWSHIRRRLTGQVDIDDVDDN